MRNVKYEYEIGDYLQWREYDAEVIGVDREMGFVTVECHDGDETFTQNVADGGTRRF